MCDRIFGVFLLVCGAILGAYAGRSERQALAADTDAISVGAGIRFICQTSAPTPTGRGRLWMRCSDGALVYTSTTNTDYTVKP